MYLFVCAYECRCLWRWIWGKCPGVSELPQMGAGNWAKVLLKNSASLNWEALSPTLTLLLALWCLSLLLFPFPPHFTYCSNFWSHQPLVRFFVLWRMGPGLSLPVLSFPLPSCWEHFCVSAVLLPVLPPSSLFTLFQLPSEPKHLVLPIKCFLAPPAWPLS